MYFYRTTASAAIVSVLALSAAPALADVTAPELWLEWQQDAQEMGLEMSVASQSYANGTMTLTGLTSVSAFPDGQATFLIPEVILTDQADGSVRVDMPDAMMLEMAPDGGDEPRIKMSLSHEGLNLVAGGTPEARTYDYAADSMVLKVDEVTEGKEVIPVEVSVLASDFDTTYTISGRGTDVPRVATTGRIAKLLADATVDVPGEPGVVFSYELKEIDATSDGPLMSVATSMDPTALFGADQSNEAHLTHKGGGYMLLVKDPSEPFELNGSSSGGGFDMKIGDGSVSYGIRSEGVKMMAQTSDLPFPIELAADTLAAKLNMPLLASEMPKDFGLSLNLSALDISEGLWAMIDESATLPRDPATLILALSGKVQLFVDLIDEEAMDSSDVPGDITEISVDELQLKAVGADLTGSGAFTVDTKSTGVIPDAPKLVGTANLALTGGNALLDNLVKMGAIQADEVMGFRMMMGMVARPGDTPDSLVSKIELTESGGLIANGMQLQ